MSDFDDLQMSMADGQTLAGMRAASTMEDNPDEAAQAYGLSRQIGVPSTIVQADLPGFEQQHKTNLAQDIIRNNPMIANYIQSHPLASSISNDDYGNLDTFSAAAKAFHGIVNTFENSAKAMMNPPEAFKEGFGEVNPLTWSTEQEQKDYPQASRLWGSIASTAMIPLQLGAGATSEIASEVLGKDLGHNVSQAILDPGLAETLQGLGPAGTIPAAIEGLIAKTRPLIRSSAIKSNADGVVALSQMTDAAQSSMTRERAPDLFVNFAEQHMQGRQMGLSGARALELYGDKLPEPGDGLLGDMPNIAEQLDAARETGADISIPISDWVSKMDPAVAKDLSDDLRVVPGGITANEAKLEQVVKETEEQNRVPEEDIPLPDDSAFQSELTKLHETNPEDGNYSPDGSLTHALNQVTKVSYNQAEIDKAINWATRNDRPDIIEYLEQRELRQERVEARSQQAFRDKNKGNSVVDESLPLIRGDLGLEPLFSIGDRKLQLQRMAQEKDTGQFGPAQGFHDFDMVNENGEPVGTINISEINGGKGLHVDMINGLGEYYNPNRFGPALIRDLRRQLKAEFPNAEYITGHRVTGARDAVGSISGPSAMPKVKLDAPLFEDTSHTDFRSILTGSWMPLHEESGLYARVRPSEFMSANEHKIGDAVEAAAKRVAPNMQHALVDTIADRSGKSAAQGVFLRYNQQAPLIAIALDHPDPVGTLLHESIHHLKREGFFKPEEWQTLVQAAKDEGWIGKHRIDERYADLNDQGRLEESIADAYSQWDKEYQERSAKPDFQPTLVDQIFSKLKALFEGIKDRLTKLMGKEPSFEDLFQSVSEGEVGRRTPQRTNPADLALSKPPSVEEPGLNAESPFANARDVGMTVDQHRRYMKLIEERQQADLQKSISRIQTEQERRQSKEWKAQSEAMRPQVVDELNARPDIAADKFFGLGEINGSKLENTYRLNREMLTPEQRASIPESYQTGSRGIKADDVASLFGYQSGDQMIQAIAKLDAMRRESGMGRDKFSRSMIDAEIARRMEREHGFLEKNILADTMDQVHSDNQLDLLHEETHALALMSGEKGFDLTREQLVAQIKGKFDALPMSAVSSEKYLREVAKNGRAAELALLAQKPADAFKAKQVQYFNQIYANFAQAVEKQRRQVEKAAKPFRKADVKNIEPEYLNHIQNLLQQAGFKIGRSMENVVENLERRGGQTLEQFADAKLSESWGYRDIPVADFIVDGGMKPIDSLTTWEFKGFKQTLDALIKNAKDEHKIYREGATADRADVIKEMNDHIKTFPLKEYNATMSRWDKIKELPKSFIAGLTNMETFLNRLGRRDAESVFNKYVTYPLASAANRKSALQRQFARAYQTIGELPDKDKLVPSPLIDPLSGQPFARFTRGNVMQMIHNAGNESNWNVLAKGYGADPKVLMDWLVANSRKEDWERAQKLGTDVFGELVKLADQEYEHINGVTVDKIPLTPFTNVHGTFDGWYHPLVRDPIREGKSPLKGGAYEDGDFGHITTANGYTRKRTGSAYPVDLNPNMTPVRINQMIHDIAFRRTILETQKIFKDSSLSNTITAHYGAEYNGSNFLLPYLRGIAGSESIPSKAAATANRLSEFLRQNVISTYIGFNPFTALKHGPTAFVMSARQVGMKNFLRATQDLYGRSPSLTQANHEFAMRWSEELQRRERHWQDTIFGAHDEISGAQGLRQNIIEKGSWLVAQSDMLSAKPMWLAAYRKAIDDGDTHGAAIEKADAQVRFAHGSTAITNQPALVGRSAGALHGWLTSVYGFFGTNMQRRIELAHDINDTYKMVKEGEFTQAANNIWPISRDVFTYIIWPTMVEEWVTGLTTDDHRGWGTYLTEAGALGLASSVLYLRDVVHGLMAGNDPSVGLISSMLHDVVKGSKAPFKPNAWSKQRAGKTVGDTLAAFGHLSGMAPKTVDNAIHFGIDLVNKQARPRSIGDWGRGITKGQIEPRQVK